MTIKTYQEEYENLDKLGEGAFAAVYKVRHKTLGYIRTVRRLKTKIEDENNKIYRDFIEECRLLLLLGNGGHPNIVKINQPRLLYHTEERENQACVEMEYIKGVNISELLKQKHNFVEAEEVLSFVKDISSALSYCHYDIYEFLVDMDVEYEYKLNSKLKGQKFRVKNDLCNGNKLDITPLQEQELIDLFKVCHNDIHAGNIIRKHNGNFILLDFGLAIKGDEVVRSTKKKAGVAEYWAPERFEQIISEQTDIYAFGVLSYYLLTGKLPFVYSEQDKQNSFEPEDVQLQRKHKNTPPPPIELLRKAAYETANQGKTYTKDYPDWLEKVIMKCLEKKIENRYANGKELYEEVKLLVETTNAVPSANDEEFELLKNQNEVLSEELSKLAYEKQQLENRKSVIVEKIVEKPVEKIVERIIEKPVEKIVYKTNPAWIVLCCIFGIAALIGFGSNFINSGTTKTLNEGSIGQFEDLQQQLSYKQTEIETLQGEVISLKQQLAANPSNPGGSDNFAELQQQISQLKADKTSLQNQLATAKSGSSNSAELQRQINSKNSEIKRLNSEVSSLKEQLKDKQKKLDAFLNNM